MNIENLFLYKVYRYNKKLFFLFLAFTGVTLFCNLTGFEITPFYVWGMYSQKEIPAGSYTIYRISVNDKLLDYSTGYLPANRFFLTSPLSYFETIKDDNDPTLMFLNHKLVGNYSFIKAFALNVMNSKNDIEKFPEWYKRYLEQTTGEKVKRLTVDVLQVSYTADNSIKIDSVYNLIDEQ